MWGPCAFNLDSALVQKDLKQVVALASAGDVFAALRSDGKVVTWTDEPDQIFPVPADLEPQREPRKEMRSERLTMLLRKMFKG